MTTTDTHLPPVDRLRKALAEAHVWRIAAIGLVVRLLYMTLAHTYRIRPYMDHFNYGWEMGRIARALVTGYGYSDPFHGHTGPTAWLPPVYPLLIAGVFKVAGVYTPLSAWIILAFNCVFSALLIRTTWEVAWRCFGSRVAWWSAWVWALYPAAMQYAVRWVWEMTLSALLLSCAMVLALRMRGVTPDGGAPGGEEAGLGRWALFGLVWGTIALLNPSLLIFLPFCGLWVLFGQGRAWARHLPRVGVASVIFLALITPWTVRNWRVLHIPVPLRDNFGAELYMGNAPGANGSYLVYDHPGQDIPQLRLYARMGEVAYVRMRGERAKEIIAGDKPRFFLLSLKRIYFFWAGVPHPGDDGPLVEYGRGVNFLFGSIVGLLGLALALKGRKPGVALLAGAFFFLPLTYYFVAAHARFRHPLEPLIAILAVFLFQSAQKSSRVWPWRAR